MDRIQWLFGGPPSQTLMTLQKTKMSMMLGQLRPHLKGNITNCNIEIIISVSICIENIVIVSNK